MKKKLCGAIAALFLFLALAAPAQAERTDNLVKAVSHQAGITEQQAEQQVKTVFNAVQSELEAGREVSVRRFGRFWIQDRSARQAKNPKTGAAVDVPAKRYPKFASSDLLKEKLNPERPAAEGAPARESKTAGGISAHKSK